MNLRSLPGRLTPSLVVVIGIAGVVGVLVSVLGMATGLRAGVCEYWRSLARHRPAQRRTQRGPQQHRPRLGRTDLGRLPACFGVRKARRPPAPVLLLESTFPSAPSGDEARCDHRGIGPGRLPRAPGSERSPPDRCSSPGCAGGHRRSSRLSRVLGPRYRPFGGAREAFLWTVVRPASRAGATRMSPKSWSDAPTAMSAFNWGAYSSVTVRLDSPASLDRFRSTLLTNSSLEVDVLHEQDASPGTRSNSRACCTS